MEDSRQLVYNAVKCLECGTELVSYYRHDYKSCDCDNQTSVDGGLSYLRYGGVDLKKVESKAVYLDDDYELVRRSFHWGTRGIDGKSSLKYRPLNKLSNEHIVNIIFFMKDNMPMWTERLFRDELVWREKNGIVIKD